MASRSGNCYWACVDRSVCLWAWEHTCIISTRRFEVARYYVRFQFQRCCYVLNCKIILAKQIYHEWAQLKYSEAYSGTVDYKSWSRKFWSNSYLRQFCVDVWIIVRRCCENCIQVRYTMNSFGAKRKNMQVAPWKRVNRNITEEKLLQNHRHSKEKWKIIGRRIVTCAQPQIIHWQNRDSKRKS